MRAKATKERKSRGESLSEREKDIVGDVLDRFADESWCSRQASSDCSAHALLSTSASEVEKATEEVEESTVAEVRPREGRVRNYRGAKKFRIERVLFRYVPSGLEKMNYALSIDESLEVNVLFESHTGPCDYQPESRRSPVRASIGTDFMDVGSARNCAKGTGRNVEFHHYRAFSLLFLGNDLNNAGFRIDSVRVRDTFIKEVRREWDLF